MALNNDTKETAFFVCKWNNDGRKEYFGVTAKRMDGRDALRRDGYLAFDLWDF